MFRAQIFKGQPVLLVGTQVLVGYIMPLIKYTVGLLISDFIVSWTQGKINNSQIFWINPV